MYVCVCVGVSGGVGGFTCKVLFYFIYKLKHLRVCIIYGRHFLNVYQEEIHSSNSIWTGFVVFSNGFSGGVSGGFSGGFIRGFSGGNYNKTWGCIKYEKFVDQLV